MVRVSRRQILQSSLGAAALVISPRLSLAETAEGILELTAGPSRQALYGEAISDLWTYNGNAPGPEIRVRRGERVRVRLRNELEELTSIHWHGIRIDNAMDGVSGLTQDAVPPGGTFDYDFTVPDAGTYWYHAHNRSWNQVARGLYGPLIVEEDEPVFDREADLTLVLDDWRLNHDAVLDTKSFGALMDWSHGGRLGNWLTVNGASRPAFGLEAGKAHRLRLINAANARILAIDPNRFGARVIAYGGRALAAPERVAYAPLLIGPAQRVDLLVIPEAGQDFAIDEVFGGEAFPMADFVISGPGSEAVAEISLPQIALPEPLLEGAKTVRLHMTGGAMGGNFEIVYKGKRLSGQEFRDTGQVWAFNGIANLAEAPLLLARRGETVVIETVNDTAFPHAMHVHGHHFRILDRSGSSADDGNPWRDTFLVGPGQTTRIVFVADNPGKWLLHCHMLEHAAAGMNTWFQVS